MVVYHHQSKNLSNEKIITLLLVLATSTSSVFAQQPVEFKLSCSEPYAVYDFITKISDNYPDNELKSIFSNSKYNTEAFKNRLQTLNSCQLIIPMLLRNIHLL
ncbi:hypothetical protein H9W95_17540 [Flavobacterium lindanitolerans]|nr:hypothetical protein [Flavobacterium lindanitolerans]